MAFISNQDGQLHLIGVATGNELQISEMPSGVVSRLKWHSRLPHIGFELSTAMTMIRSNAVPMLLVLLLLATAAIAQNAKLAKQRILVLCTGNSARSQMAAGFLNSWDRRLVAYSAGTNPSAKINPFAVQAMNEVGIDISSGYPKSVMQFIGQSFDYVITVCDDADQSCPNFTGKVGRRVHIGFSDPAQATGTDAEKMAVFRKVRDDIQKRFREFYDNDIRKTP